MYSYTIMDTGIITVTKHSNAVSLYPIDAKLTTAKPANEPARIRRALATKPSGFITFVFLPVP